MTPPRQENHRQYRWRNCSYSLMFVSLTAVRQLSRRSGSTRIVKALRRRLTVAVGVR